MTALRAYVLTYPLVLPLAFFGTWLAGRFSLGYWPRPSLDDPKQIGFWVDVPYHITALLVSVGLPAFMVALVALVYRASRDGGRRRRLLMMAALAVTGLMVSIALLRWDPWGVVAWYAD